MKQLYLLKKRGRFWYVRFAFEESFLSIGLTNKNDAITFANQESRTRPPPKDKEPTFKDYSRDFFIWDNCRWVARQRAKKRRCTKAVADSRRGHLVNHIFPKFGRQMLCDITAVEVEDWLVSLPLANQTKNHILYSFSIVMREAKRGGIIDKNLVEDVEPMGKDFRPTPALTDQELAALFPVGPTEFNRIWPQFQFGVMFALLASSGMRPGEARALEWPSFIFDIPAVLVVQAVTGSDELGPTKGKWKRGAILPERTAGLLYRWQDTCNLQHAHAADVSGQCNVRGSFKVFHRTSIRSDDRPVRQSRA